MRTLAVRQPWATHIAEGTKIVELRSWQTKYRGPVLIAASGKPLKVTNDNGVIETLPTQVLVCVVDLINVFDVTAENLDDVIEMAGCSTAPGFHYAWLLNNPRMVRPVPHKGKLNLYETPETAIEYLPPDLHFLDAA